MNKTVYLIYILEIVFVFLCLSCEKDNRPPAALLHGIEFPHEFSYRGNAASRRQLVYGLIQNDLSFAIDSSLTESDPFGFQLWRRYIFNDEEIFKPWYDSIVIVNYGQLRLKSYGRDNYRTLDYEVAYHETNSDTRYLQIDSMGFGRLEMELFYKISHEFSLYLRLFNYQLSPKVDKIEEFDRSHVINRNASLSDGLDLELSSTIRVHDLGPGDTLAYFVGTINYRDD